MPAGCARLIAWKKNTACAAYAACSPAKENPPADLDGLAVPPTYHRECLDGLNGENCISIAKRFLRDLNLSDGDRCSQERNRHKI